MITFEKSAASEVITEPISGEVSGRQGQVERILEKLQRPKPMRPSWLEIDLDKLGSNFDSVLRNKPKSLSVCSVVKDDAYGHGALQVAKVLAEYGVSIFAVSTLDEALELREGGISAPIMVLGERSSEELPWVVHYQLQCCVNRLATVNELERIAREANKKVKVHVKIDTGMSRYGVRWNSALGLIETVARSTSIILEGVMSHFAMSDEIDKSFANLQFSRFEELLKQMHSRGIEVQYRHMCNSGGFLDLPHAHLDLVRIGLLPLGVYPSKVCRRIPGIKPIMEVKSRIASIRNIEPGETVGYGMRFKATSPRRIGVLPIGYGDGYPRVRNQGYVLVHGKRAPVTGANAMDATMVDLSEVPESQIGDVAVLMGHQGDQRITVHDIASWGNTVSYDVLSGWRSRLPRIYLGHQA